MEKLRLADLLGGMSEDNRRPEIDFGPPVGREFPNEEPDELDRTIAFIDANTDQEAFGAGEVGTRFKW